MQCLEIDDRCEATVDRRPWRSLVRDLAYRATAELLPRQCDVMPDVGDVCRSAEPVVVSAILLVKMSLEAGLPHGEWTIERNADGSRYIQGRIDGGMLRVSETEDGWSITRTEIMGME